MVKASNACCILETTHEQLRTYVTSGCSVRDAHASRRRLRHSRRSLGASGDEVVGALAGAQFLLNLDQQVKSVDNELHELAL